MIKSEKDKVFQNISDQEKKEFNTLIKNKNVSVCINDTDKNMGACNTDKVNAIKECDRQLQEPGVYKKLFFEEMENFIKEIETKLRGIIEKFEYKECITQTEKDFLLSKNKCLRYPIFTLFGKFSKFLQLVDLLLQNMIGF